MEASDSQLERVFDLAERFAKMRGRGVTEVILALFYSDTLRRYGYDGSGHLTPKQAEVCTGILESWIRKVGGAPHGHQGR